LNPPRYVIDASVGVKLAIVETGTDKVRALFHSASRDMNSRLYVPTLFFVECANVLWKCVWRQGYSAKQAGDNLLELQSLPLAKVETTQLLPLAWQLSLEYRLSIYDACYVALSEVKEMPLLTADIKLVQRLAGSKHQVVSLDSLPL